MSSIRMYGITFVAATLFILLFATTTHAQTLTIGSRGADITQLQTFLQETGDFTYPEITGYFGTITAQAVQKYQCRLNIVCSGTPSSTGYGQLGPSTRATIQSRGGLGTQTTLNTTQSAVSGMQPPTLTRSLYKGTRGADVTALQTFLRSTGDFTYAEITGYYGTVTEEAVKRYQRRMNLVSSGTPDTTGYGVVGPKTRAALARRSTPTPTTPPATTPRPNSSPSTIVTPTPSGGGSSGGGNSQDSALTPITTFTLPPTSQLTNPTPPPQSATPTPVYVSEAIRNDTWVSGAAPVFTKGAAGKWDSNSVYAPRIVHNIDGSTYVDPQGNYYMYYTASDGSDNTDYDATGLAISKDLINWTKVSVNAPVLPRGAPGFVDAGDASAVTVIHDGSIFHMWHEANATPPGITTGDYVRIAYATSKDGRVWDKRGWVIGPGGSSYYRQDVYGPAVVYDEGTWKMWFSGHDESGRIAVMHATAPAPAGPWTLVSQSFVFHPSDSTFVSEVWKEGNDLHMLYMSGGSRLYAKMISGVWVAQKDLTTTLKSGAWQGGDVGAWQTRAVKDGSVYMFYGADVYRGGGIGYVVNTANSTTPTAQAPAPSTPTPTPTPVSYVPIEIKGPTNNDAYTTKRIPQVWGYCDSRGSNVSVTLGSFTATAGCAGNKFTVDNFDNTGGPGNVALRASQTRPNSTLSSQQINVYFNY